MKWYKYDIRDLSDEEYKKWYSLMSVNKQQRVNRFRFADDKKRTVTGEMLARKAIAEWCNVSEEEIRFGKLEYGKPFAVGLDVEFNISHSGDIVVCVVDNEPVGIDVELIRPIDLKVAKHICTDEEFVYIWGYKPSETDFNQTYDNRILNRFFKIWTLKEAYGKCIGTGMTKLQKLNVLSSSVHKKTSMLGAYIVSICYEREILYNWEEG